MITARFNPGQRVRVAHNAIPVVSGAAWANGLEGVVVSSERSLDGYSIIYLVKLDHAAQEIHLRQGQLEAVQS